MRIQSVYEKPSCDKGVSFYFFAFTSRKVGLICSLIKILGIFLTALSFGIGSLPVLIPLFVSSFRRADELAFAMDARCYNATDKRTKMKKPKIKFSDVLAAFVVLSFFTVILLERYYFPCVGINIDAMIFGGLL